MKKRIALIKQQVGDESQKALMVVIGFASGALISKGLDMLSEKFPEAEPFVRYSKPIVLGGGGLLISSATTKEEKIKYLGYGLTAAAAYEGIKIIPVAKEFFGFNGTDGDSPSTYYTESNLRNVDLGNFGINALPIKSFSVEDTPSYNINLPDLQYNVSGTRLGYNGGATDDVDDIRGII